MRVSIQPNPAPAGSPDNCHGWKHDRRPRYAGGPAGTLIGMTQTAQAVSAGAAVALHGLRKRYGDVQAVADLDLVIAPGEVVALLDPNGAGKSTTVDMLLGLTRPDGGDVRIFGQVPRAAVRAGTVGAMLQNGALRDQATVAETVGAIAALHGRPERTAAVLAQVGIADMAKRRCNKLSGGQKQRVRFALALVSDPDLLVLDEPTVAMDVQIRRQFWQAMREYTAPGRTVLFATHYLEEAQEYADRVVLLRAGRAVHLRLRPTRRGGGVTSGHPSNQTGPRIGSVCTGYGGLDLAVHAVLGGQLAWYADNDPAASRILAARFPGVANLGDLRTVDWHHVQPVDLLTAGFPCQDYSE